MISKYELWAQRVIDWQASGLSQMAYGRFLSKKNTIESRLCEKKDLINFYYSDKFQFEASEPLSHGGKKVPQWHAISWQEFLSVFLVVHNRWLLLIRFPLCREGD